MFPTVSEMRSLHTVLIKHFATVELSDDPYQTGNFTGDFAVSSSLRSLFQDLVAFCEKDLGFKRPSKWQESASLMEARYAREKRKVKLERERVVVCVFGKLPHLRRSNDPSLLGKLSRKLAEYQVRLKDVQGCRHPELALMVDPAYRDAAYKIEVLSMLLKLDDGRELDFGAMAGKALEQHRDHFFPEEYLNACGVIAHYAEQPFEGSCINKELPEPVQV